MTCLTRDGKTLSGAAFPPPAQGAESKDRKLMNNWAKILV
jgi:hypothetical protein